MDHTLQMGPYAFDLFDHTPGDMLLFLTKGIYETNVSLLAVRPINFEHVIKGFI